MMTSEPLKVPPEALCRGCGYALRELTVPRCPECGRLFDPRDPRTWTSCGGIGSRQWWRVRLDVWTRAPARWEIHATIIATLIALGRAMSLPWCDKHYAMQILWGAVRCLAVLIAVRLGFIGVRRLVPTPRMLESQRTLRFLCAPLCVAVLLIAVGWRETVLQRGCIRYRQPLARLSRDSLKHTGPVLRRVGSFGIVSAASQPGGSIRLTIDLDYNDRWSTHPRHVFYDPSAVIAPGHLDAIPWMKGFYLERSMD